MFPLTCVHLRFTLEALTPLRLGGLQAGANLRGALGGIMRQAHCTEVLRGHAAPSARDHAATCPVCWLLAADEHPGQERRGYALTPPLNLPAVYPPGGRFQIGLTLFGSAQRFLPYFALAIPEMGRNGVGPGRGQFLAREVWAADPLTNRTERLLGEGEAVVRAPTLIITHPQVEAAAAHLEAGLAACQPARAPGAARLGVDFQTPMRLVSQGALVKLPDFGALFARLLRRLDELSQQFAAGLRRPPDEVQALQTLADRVRLLAAQTKWVEVWSGSSRSERDTPLSGFVGRATYTAPLDVWRPLLPWLLWGQAVQAGKDVVKGNGVFQCRADSPAASTRHTDEHRTTSDCGRVRRPHRQTQ